MEQPDSTAKHLCQQQSRINQRGEDAAGTAFAVNAEQKQSGSQHSCSKNGVTYAHRPLK